MEKSDLSAICFMLALFGLTFFAVGLFELFSYTPTLTILETQFFGVGGILCLIASVLVYSVLEQKSLGAPWKPAYPHLLTLRRQERCRKQKNHCGVIRDKKQEE